MHYKKLFLFSSLATILLLITPLVGAEQNETFIVDVLSSRVIIFNLDKGAKFNGSFTVRGGSENDIDFYITEPSDSRIIDFGRVSRTATFEFAANESGAYTLRFDNSFSWFSPKAVALTYDVGEETPNPIVPKNVQISIAVELAIIMGLILVGAASVVFLKRSKHKTVA